MTGRELKDTLLSPPALNPVSKLFFNPFELRGIPRSIPRSELQKLIRRGVIQKIGRMIIVRSKIKL